MLPFFFWLCLVIFIIVCLFLILLILIQKGRGGGLASAFGGAGGNTAFGSKTGDVLTWATSIVFGIFIVLAIVLNLISNELDKRFRAEMAARDRIVIPTPQASPIQQMLNGQLPPVEGPAAAPAPTESPTPAPTTAPAK